MSCMLRTSACPRIGYRTQIIPTPNGVFSVIFLVLLLLRACERLAADRPRNAIQVTRLPATVADSSPSAKSTGRRKFPEPASPSRTAAGNRAVARRSRSHRLASPRRKPRNSSARSMKSCSSPATTPACPSQHKVKRKLITRESVESYVEKRMKDDKDAQRLEQSRLVLEKFGLLPPGLRPALRVSSPAGRAGCGLLRSQVEERESARLGAARHSEAGAGT